jgi:type IX secretion system PorP/SprF family membrane protein
MNRQVSTATAILRRTARRVALSAGLSLAVAAGASAQSFRDFSQFHLTPTLVNPASAGLDNDFKVLYGQRQQSIGANSFISHAVSLTYPFFGERNGQQVRTSHVGLTYVSDRAGIGGLLNVNGFMGSYSYNLSLNEEHRIGLGIQVGFYNRSVNRDLLRSGAQFNGSTGSYDPSLNFGELELTGGNNSTNYAVVNGGVQYFREVDSQVRHHIGLAWQNINQPLYSFNAAPKANLPAIFVVDGGINILPVENRFVVEPNFRAVYLNADNNQINLGSLFKYKLDESDATYGHIGVGAWYSLNNAAILSAEVSIPYFFAGYSYDATVSNLARNAAASTHEIVVGYRMNRYKASPKVDVTPPPVTPKRDTVKPVAPVVKPTPPPAPPKVVEPEPVKVEPVAPVPAVVEEPVVAPKPPKVKPAKRPRATKRAKAPKAAKASKGKAKYAIDRNNVALASKYKLTPAEVAVMNRKPAFNLNDWELSDDSKKQLEDLAEVMKNHPDMRVEIGGHTCTIGTDAQNQIVGSRRCDAGFDYLTGKGTDASKLSKNNYTSTLPIGDNTTSDGRVKNRRISFKIIE